METYWNHHDPESTSSFFEARREYNQVLLQEQTFWEQRAKMHWLRDDDLNIKFFHMSEMTRNNFKKIDMLINDDDVEVKYQVGMYEIANNYFENLFAGKECRHDPIISIIQPIISNTDNDRLVAPVSKEEMHEDLIHMRKTLLSDMTNNQIKHKSCKWDDIQQQ